MSTTVHHITEPPVSVMLPSVPCWHTWTDEEGRPVSPVMSARNTTHPLLGVAAIEHLTQETTHRWQDSLCCDTDSVICPSHPIPPTATESFHLHQSLHHPLQQRLPL